MTVDQKRLIVQLVQAGIQDLQRCLENQKKTYGSILPQDDPIYTKNVMKLEIAVSLLARLEQSRVDPLTFLDHFVIHQFIDQRLARMNAEFNDDRIKLDELKQQLLTSE